MIDLGERDLEPRVSVDECVAVVVDPEHKRFAEVAELLAHDFTDSGLFLVQYSDGSAGSLRDGWSSDVSTPQAVALREGGSIIVEDFVERLILQRPALREIIRIGETEAIDDRPREIAKAAFLGVLNNIIEG